VTIAPATHPAGQTRVDLIVVQVRDTQIDAGANTDFIVTSVAGTPAALGVGVETPDVEAPEAGTKPGGDEEPRPPLAELLAGVAPAVPANALVLAQVVVPGAVANLNTATITDKRIPALAVSASCHARYYRSGAWNFGPSWGILPFENRVYDDVGLYVPAAGFTVPFAGVWRMRVQVTGVVPSTPVPNWFQINIQKGGGNMAAAGGVCTAVNVTSTQTAEHTARAAAGELWVPGTLGGGGCAGGPGAFWTFLVIDYLGP
jgi:hypothetical protein